MVGNDREKEMIERKNEIEMIEIKMMRDRNGREIEMVERKMRARKK